MSGTLGAYTICFCQVFPVLFADSFLHATGNMASNNLGLSSYPRSPSTSKERGFLPLWLQPGSNPKNDLYWINGGCILLPKPHTKPGRWGNMIDPVNSACPPLSLEGVRFFFFFFFFMEGSLLEQAKIITFIFYEL